MRRLFGLLRVFAKARGGNTAIIFGFTLFPLLLLTGAAVDFSHGNAVKASFQSALDSTALLLAREAALDTPAQLQTNAENYFHALFNKSEATNVAINVSYSGGSGSQIVISGSASVPTNFMGLVGYDSLAINVSTTTKWGSSRLRVALVLD
ncbi:MAG: pilus assembly protein TadG, partial [Pseudolabrys sp.]|nr:pilus assembly protein TadG [Pseudolabrys sp.]